MSKVLPLRKVESFNLKWLICGNPCGATTFTALFLRNVGLACGHEAFAYARGENDLCWQTNQPDAETLEADCSYILIQDCDFPPLDTLPIIGLLRNPYKVIQARMGNHLDHGQVVDPNAIIEEIIGRYHRIVHHPRTLFICKVEEGLHDLCAFLSLPWKPLDWTPSSHNRGRLSLDKASFERYEKFPLLEQFATSFGYRL